MFTVHMVTVKLGSRIKKQEVPSGRQPRRHIPLPDEDTIRYHSVIGLQQVRLYYPMNT